MPNDLENALNTSTGGISNVVVTWEEAKSFSDEGTGKTVDLTSAWEKNMIAIKALTAENLETMLLKGKRTTQGLKKHAADKSTNRIKFGEFNLNFGQRLEADELNCQRLTALMALCNGFLREKGKRVQTAMGSAIPVTAGIDERYDDFFHSMLAPGYGFLYKPLFIPTTATDIKTAEGDKGRYFAGAVELDWLQYCSTTTLVSLNDFAKAKYYVNMNGTVRQVVINSGHSELKMDDKELGVYKKIVGRNVFPSTGKKSNERIRAAVSTWNL